MQMPMGKFSGQPVEAMSTTYLMWVLANDHIRFSRRPLVEEALRVLRGRFERFDDLLAELKVDAPPPPRWRTAEREAARSEARAAKLAALEECRQAQRKRMADELRERVARNRLGKPQHLEPAPGAWRDASCFVREARLKGKQGDDVSDLV